MTRNLLAAVSVVGLFLAGCAETVTTEPPAAAAPAPTLEGFIAAGATASPGPDLIEGDAVSITYPQFGTVVYAADGTKVFTTNDGTVIQRSWERRADGVICEELVRDARVVCYDDQDTGGFFQLDGELLEFAPGTGALRSVVTQTGPGMYVAEPA